MGDRGDDPRVGSEDGYFYFVPSANKTKQNCFYIPKFVNEDHLFLGQNNDKLTIFVDHYTRCQPKEMDLSVRAIKEVFRQLSTAEVPLRIFYPTSKGVEIDPKEPEIADKSIKEIYKQIPFSEIAKYYRQTHIFFPTHRETQGMVAQEIGACGGITLMQEWMYPKETHYQFPHFLYIPGQKINFTKIQEYIFMDDVRKKIRTHVLKNCGFDLFKNILIKTIINLK